MQAYRSSIAQSVCHRAFRLLAIWCLRSWVRILHSAEEDNVSPFDSNIVCLSQSIDINNNKYNKTKLNKTICIFYGMYCICSNGSIRSQRSLLLTWSPSYASPITKLFMILVSRARRPATIPWAIILEPYHLATSLQVVWNLVIRGWTAMFALGPLLIKEIGETIIEISTWISKHIEQNNAMLLVIHACICMPMASLDC